MGLIPNFLKASLESHVFPSKSILSWSLVMGNQLKSSRRDARVFIINAGVGIFSFVFPLAFAMIEINSFQLKSSDPPRW